MPSIGDQMRSFIAVTIPPATAVCVGTLTDKHTASQSPLTARSLWPSQYHSTFWAALFEVALLELPWSGLRGVERLYCCFITTSYAYGSLW